MFDAKEKGGGARRGEPGFVMKHKPIFTEEEHMKKIFLLLVALFTALLFVGGVLIAQEIPKGVKVAGSPEVMPTQAEIIKAIPPSLKTLGRGKTIRIMFQGGGDSAPPLELKDLIEKQTGLKLEIDVIPPDNLHEKQLTFFTSGSSEYDLLELYPTWIGEYAESEYIDNLDDLYKKFAGEINTSDFILGAQVGFDQYKGSWYAIPYDGDVNLFYYRKDLFDNAKNKADFKAKYKYDLAPPKTWDQVHDIAEFFTGRTKDFYGFGTLALKTWWAVDYWANVYRNVLASKDIKFDNGLVSDEGTIELDRASFIEANDFYMKLMKFSPPGILSWGYPESKEGLGNGVVAMSMQWATAVFRDPRQAKYWDKIHAVTMPGFKKRDGSVKGVTSFAVGKALVIPSASENKDVAFLYAQFLASTTMQIYETNSGSGVDPNRYSVWKDQRTKDVWGPLVDPTMKSLDIGIGDIKVPQASQLYETLLNELHASWSGDQTSAKAYDRVIKQWGKILD
jgi:multiple sugar transport system substrate-binding protein